METIKQLKKIGKEIAYRKCLKEIIVTLNNGIKELDNCEKRSTFDGYEKIKLDQDNVDHIVNLFNKSMENIYDTGGEEMYKDSRKLYVRLHNKLDIYTDRKVDRTYLEDKLKDTAYCYLVYMVNKYSINNADKIISTLAV